MKLMKYFTLLAAAAGLMSACTSDLEMVQTLPADKVVAPVLHELESTEIVITAETLINTFPVSWDAAYFGDKIVPSYSVYLSNEGKEVAVVSGISACEAALTYEQINLAASESLALPSDVVSPVKLRVGATVGNSYSTYYTEYKDITIQPTTAEKKYPMIYMPGSYQGWNPGDAATKFQVLYDFSNTGVFEGIADFGAAEDTSREWKFTKEPDWSFDWGIPAGETPDAEAAEVTLINNDGGDRSNINIYQAKRFYHFSMNTGSGLLKKNYSFNQVGVVGELNGWNGDEVMEFNAAKRRFYVDIENFSGEFKFRADAAWDMNWGGAAFGLEGDNLKVEEAGNYRVYLYLSNSAEMYYELSAAMFGKEEPTGNNAAGGDEPEEPKEDVYGLVGTPNGWGESADAALEVHNGSWIAYKGYTVTADDQFKIRVNSDWAVNYGGDGDVEPFALTAGETYTLVSGGKNMSAAAGTYDVYFNVETAEFIIVEAGGADPTLPSEAKAVKFYADVTATGWSNCNIYGWGELGDYGGNWPGTALETESVDGKEYYVYTFPLEGYGKTVNVIFNNGAEQTVDIKDVVLDKDYIFTLTEKDGSGKWLATLNGEAPVTPEPPADLVYGLVGTPNGWGGSADAVLEAHSGDWLVYKGYALTAADQFKVRANSSWDINYGAAGDAEPFALTAGEVYTLVSGGKNMSVTADGSYDVYFNKATFGLVVVAAGSDDPTANSDVWSVIGDFQVGNWSSDITFVPAGNLMVAQDVVFANANNEGLVFKVRKNMTWDTSYGVSNGYARAIGSAIALDGGSNIAIDGEVGVAYDIYFRVSDMTLWVVADGATPEI